MAAKTQSKLMPSSVIKAKGQSKTISEFAAALGCPVQTILGRLERGWSNDRAVSEPVGKIGGGNRGTKQAAEVFTPEELAELLKQCNDGSTGQRNRALIVLGWRAGLRISEALALKVADLTEAQQTIRVRHGKGDKARTVGLDGQAWAVLRTWLDVRATLGQVDQSSPLFCTLSGGPLSSRYVRELLPRLAKSAAIDKRCHFHGLRHTMAFELASEGVPMHLIQQQLGHSNLAITSRYISHLNPAETVARMKSREWGSAPTSSQPANGLPSPGWLDQLRAAIGPRLRTCIDSRKSQDDFSAVVVLF
jgi:integrase